MYLFTRNTLQVNFEAYGLCKPYLQRWSNLVSLIWNYGTSIHFVHHWKKEHILWTTFDLPCEDIAEFSKLLLINVDEIKIKFSSFGAPIKYFGKKTEMKVEYLLLNDIVIKSLTAKDGSFDVFMWKTSSWCWPFPQTFR